MLPQAQLLFAAKEFLHMSLRDWIASPGAKKRGGQGTVVKVHHRNDGRTGALKRPHGIQINEARRYRVLKEVSALRAMNSNGVPTVFEANEHTWRRPNANLYLVMEYIEGGATLKDAVKNSPPTLGQALAATKRILEILSASHGLSIVHRDLKPDNVVFRNKEWGDPILVDFGIAWDGGDEDLGFETPVEMELGNRFLRLPEFAPGGDQRDARSDVTMAAGLLFFMISGQAPRNLVDEDGLHPHEAIPSPIRREVLEDARWPMMQRILRIAFQQNIEARFQSAQDLLARLTVIDAKAGVVVDELDSIIARFRDVTNNAIARERSVAAPAMKAASEALYSKLTHIWALADIQQGGQGPTFKNGGETNEFYCVVSRQGHADPSVLVRSKIEVSHGRFQATWSIEGRGPPSLMFAGSSADAEGLREALLTEARKIGGAAIQELTDKLPEPGFRLEQFYK